MIKEYFLGKIYKQKRDDLIKVIKVQTSDGNWNYDAYMHGLANGLLLAESIVFNTKYEPLEKPQEYLVFKDMPLKK